MKTKKIKSVSFNNRKRQLTVRYVSGKEITVHYGNMGIASPIESVWVDRETRGLSVGIRLANGRVEYMPYDQPLAVAKDPEFLLQNQIEVFTAQINEAIHEKKISKRYLAEQLHTSDNQIYRLLNPKIVNKNLSQLYQIGSLLGLEFEISLRAA